LKAPISSDLLGHLMVPWGFLSFSFNAWMNDHLVFQQVLPIWADLTWQGDGLIGLMSWLCSALTAAVRQDLADLCRWAWHPQVPGPQWLSQASGDNFFIFLVSWAVAAISHPHLWSFIIFMRFVNRFQWLLGISHPFEPFAQSFELLT
jgi:hypothetical protein